MYPKKYYHDKKHFKILRNTVKCCFTGPFHKKGEGPIPKSASITVENVLESKLLVQSGSFKGTGTPPVILPGQSVSFTFSAAKNQRLTFATMYGWSNDLFFAPANPGIKLYNDDGSPITGDVSSQIKLWDNGTRINQVPGMNVTHPGAAETTIKNVKEVNGSDDFGNPTCRIAIDETVACL